MSDPFDRLGVPATFDLTGDQLRTALVQASAAHHPDRFTDPADQATAQDAMAEINRAHDLLADPIARARALLARLTGDADPSNAETDPAPPPELLMEVLDVREAIDDARAANDTAALHRQRAWVKQQLTQRYDQVARLFSEDSQPQPLDSASIRRELSAARYFQRMLDAIDQEP
ncbi:MAG: iron-sulfur cluster co-chaperone HscB C-terminal domain-containing protein [Planctomycetota bacterium]